MLKYILNERKATVEATRLGEGASYGRRKPRFDQILPGYDEQLRPLWVYTNPLGNTYPSAHCLLVRCRQLLLRMHLDSDDRYSSVSESNKTGEKESPGKGKLAQRWQTPQTLSISPL